MGVVTSQLRFAKHSFKLARVPGIATSLASLPRLSQADVTRCIEDPAIAGEAESTVARVREAVPDVFEDGKANTNAGDQRGLVALLSLRKKLERVLEIGTNRGGTTLILADYLSRHGSGKVVTLDIFDANGAEGAWARKGREHPPAHHAETLGLKDRIEFVTADSGRFLRETRDRYDVIFVDGDHRAEGAYADLAVALQRLQPDGLLMMHDYFPAARRLREGHDPLPGPYLAMKRLLRENPGLKVLPVGRLPWETWPDSNATSLAVLTA